MSGVAPPDPSQTSSSAKKKSNKKKKNAKGKTNGDFVKGHEVVESPVENGDAEGDLEDLDSGVDTPKDIQSTETIKPRTNGHNYDSSSNGHAIESTSQPLTKVEPKARGVDDPNDSLESRDSDTAKSSSRFDAMSQEREALRAEVEQLRKSLENLQGKHSEEIFAIKNQHEEQLLRAHERHAEDISSAKKEQAEELATVKAELEESQSAKDQAETQYQHLLGRINTIKSSLGERLKADKQELSEAKEQIEELETHSATLRKQVQGLEGDLKRLQEEMNETSKELSSLRNRHNLSQQNWVHEREDLVQQVKQLKDEAEAAKDAMGDWEVLAMEEKRMREGLSERAADLEEQYSSRNEAYEAAVAERDTLSQKLGGLQRALQEDQEAKKRELREMVESYEEQLQSLKKLVQESDSRAAEADASKGALQTEVDRLTPFEKEIKEKNLLIGKLRHEAIVLNDHLTKALRFLKKAKPEDNIDRQIVTNHFLHFLALDRSDPKKFQILQLIAALLNWTDEQKEQAGLARPGGSNNSLRLPSSPFYRTPSTPSLSSEFFTEPPATKESLADLWTGFLERSAEEGSGTGGSRSGSVSSSAPPPRPDTRGGG